MSRATRRAIVALFIVGVLIGAANLIFTARQVNAVRAADTKAAAASARAASARAAGAAAKAAAAHAVSNSQRHWCATLDLLSAHPVHKPPRSSQFARSGAYTFYTDILDLRHRFGCG